MCAQFHPSEKLVVSGSLDQTIRVWTISSLFEKNAPVGVDLPSFELLQGYAGGGAGEGVKQAPNFSKIHEVNILGRPDGAVKHIIQAHEGGRLTGRATRRLKMKGANFNSSGSSGVNWVSFHPTLPIIVSASEDHRVKLWRFDESMAWEVDTCRGHHSEVRCAIFHPSAPFILSVSKDGSVRVWDAVKRTCLESFYHGSDKFWSLAAHPTTGSLFAAGHDGGLMVFKLQRERPPYCVRKNHVLYIKDRQLRLLDFEKR
jgi:coatomer protein complex subunit alpha (xenin)